MAKKELVGTKFSSYKELKLFMDQYQQEGKQLFPVDKSLYITEDQLNENYNKDLVYSLIIYVCKFGARFRSRGRGERQCR